MPKPTGASTKVDGMDAMPDPDKNDLLDELDASGDKKDGNSNVEHKQESPKTSDGENTVDNLNGVENNKVGIQKYDKIFIEYISTFDNTFGNPKGLTKVWRVMCKDQSILDSIVSKNELGLTTRNTPFTVEGHVATGSRTKTPYISSFTDKSKALQRALDDGGLKVVEIDLTSIDGKFFDLSDANVRNTLIQRKTTRNFAMASSEFLIVIDEIPTTSFKVIN